MRKIQKIITAIFGSLVTACVIIVCFTILASGAILLLVGMFKSSLYIFLAGLLIIIIEVLITNKEDK